MAYNIIKGKYCGFCSGVKRAVKMAEDSAETGKVYTLGPIIHNPQVVEKLRKSNIIDVIKIDEIEENSTVLIRSHGITSEKEEDLCNRKLNVIDATCPKVKKTHRICRDLSEKYDKVFIIGIKSHPEVIGILSRAHEKGVVISSVEEAADVPETDNAGVLVQTTFRRKKFFDIVSELMKKSSVIEIHNTICEETVNRQKELEAVAENADILFVIGGKNSSNTKRLYEMSCEIVESYHIEKPEDIDDSWLKDKRRIGLISGASTPINMVEKVENKIKKI
ncbi:4-hydroxy-3-methylbut-2-enyl diphosphate reductase [Elusimicrobiota bacterium]